MHLWARQLDIWRNRPGSPIGRCQGVERLVILRQTCAFQCGSYGESARPSTNIWHLVLAIIENSHHCIFSRASGYLTDRRSEEGLSEKLIVLLQQPMAQCVNQPWRYTHTRDSKENEHCGLSCTVVGTVSTTTTGRSHPSYDEQPQHSQANHACKTLPMLFHTIMTCTPRAVDDLKDLYVSNQCESRAK